MKILYNKISEHSRYGSYNHHTLQSILSPHRNKHLSHFLIFIPVCILNIVFGSQEFSSLEYNNVYRNIISKENTNPIQILKDNWQIQKDNQPYKQNITIPFLIYGDTKKIDLKYTFTIPDDLSDHSLRIWFLGLQGLSVIKINGSVIREHTNSLTSFFVDIPEKTLFKSSDNILEIVLNKPEQDDGIPNYVHLFKEKSLLGALREIYFEWLPPVHFDNISYYFNDKNLQFAFTFKIAENKIIGKRFKLEETIVSPTGNPVHKRFQYIQNKIMERTYNRIIEIPVPIYWAPEHPRLYKLILTVKYMNKTIAKIEKTIGLRLFGEKKGAFILNKKPLIVKGITFREPFYRLAANKKNDYYKQITNDFQKIKEMGFNAIRFPHSVPHPYCAYLADSLGLLLFIENGIWRLPKPLYQSNKFLQAVKTISEEIAQKFYLHPSFIALGLGNELPLDDAATSKFILIIREYIRQKYNVLSYVSPLDNTRLPQNNVTNFYLFNKYDYSIISYLNSISIGKNSNFSLPILLGNVGFPAKTADQNTNSIKSEKLQLAKMQKFFTLYKKNQNLDGFFIESYRDWPAEFTGNYTNSAFGDMFVYPYGIFTWTDKTRELYKYIPLFLAGDIGNHIKEDSVKKDSNFFSITAFIASIIFFLIYKRNYRLKENLSRTMTHPYGFFVDLRDRRIISVFNSTVMGIYAIILLVNFINAYFYYYHNNLFIQEFIYVIVDRLHIDYSSLSVLAKPWQFFIVLFVVIYILSFLLGFFIKLFSFFSKEKLRYRQILAIINWSGAPIIFFMPFSILSYHLIPYNNIQPFIIGVFILFCFWYNYRLFNGIRVLFVLRPFKIILIIILTYTLLIFTFISLITLKTEVINYLKLLTEASNLFL